MSSIAIDLWDKKVWIAIEINGIAFSRWIVPRIDLVKRLGEILSEKNELDTIVVGIPYDLYWVDNRQKDKTEKFIEKLKVIFPLYKIVWIDERFTSFEAISLNEAFWNKAKNIDDISACLILETYIKKRDL